MILCCLGVARHCLGCSYPTCLHRQEAVSLHLDSSCLTWKETRLYFNADLGISVLSLPSCRSLWVFFFSFLMLVPCFSSPRGPFLTAPYRFWKQPNSLIVSPKAPQLLWLQRPMQTPSEITVQLGLWVPIVCGSGHEPTGASRFRCLPCP